jgi:hypothetical protein
MKLLEKFEIYEKYSFIKRVFDCPWGFFKRIRIEFENGYILSILYQPLRKKYEICLIKDQKIVTHEIYNGYFIRNLNFYEVHAYIMLIGEVLK